MDIFGEEIRRDLLLFGSVPFLRLKFSGENGILTIFI